MKLKNNYYTGAKVGFSQVRIDPHCTTPTKKGYTQPSPISIGDRVRVFVRFAKGRSESRMVLIQSVFNNYEYWGILI